MAMGTAMPRLLAATGSLSLMARACSEEEGLLFASPMFAQVLCSLRPDFGRGDNALTEQSRIAGPMKMAL